MLVSEVEVLATLLFQETTRALLHFERQNGLEAPARMVLAGVTARNPELAALVGAKVMLPVQVLEMSPVLEMAPEPAEVAASFPEVTDLVGAAILHLLPGQLTVNLLPPGLRRRADRADDRTVDSRWRVAGGQRDTAREHHG